MTSFYAIWFIEQRSYGENAGKLIETDESLPHNRQADISKRNI